MPDKFLLQGLENPRVHAYYRFMHDVAILFGAAAKNSSERELRDVIQFEMELAKVSTISKQKSVKIPTFFLLFRSQHQSVADEICRSRSMNLPLKRFNKHFRISIGSITSIGISIIM